MKLIWSTCMHTYKWLRWTLLGYGDQPPN